MWQSWFNAPDLKSDEGASPPGVRIPTSPPIRKSLPLWWAFLLLGGLGFVDCGLLRRFTPRNDEVEEVDCFVVLLLAMTRKRARNDGRGIGGMFFLLFD